MLMALSRGKNESKKSKENHACLKERSEGRNFNFLNSKKVRRITRIKHVPPFACIRSLDLTRHLTP